jgi:hypothetical protein
MPRGSFTVTGSCPELADLYGAVETESENYRFRTE